MSSESTKSSFYNVKDELKSLFESTKKGSDILDTLYDIEDENDFYFLASLIKTYTNDEFYE